MAVYPWELSIEDGELSAWLNGTLNIGGDLIVDSDLTVSNDLDVAGIVQGNLFNNYMVQKAGFDVLSLMTDPRFLNIMCDDPGAGIMIDVSGQGHDGTYEGTMTSVDRLKKGMGWAIDFDGIDNTINFGDDDDFSFGDGSNDAAVTWFGVIELISGAGHTILSKWDTTTGGSELREWMIKIGGDNKLVIYHYDESAEKMVFCLTNVGITLGYHSFVITSPGTGGATAMDDIKFYIDGILVVSAVSNDAGYVAMENLSTDCRMSGHTHTDGTITSLSISDIYCIGIDGSEWSAFDAHRFHQLMKGLYGL